MIRTLSSKAVLWIFALSCLLSSARLVVDTPRVARDAAENERRSGERFASIRESLPKRGVIGYIGQPQDSPGYYYVAQYALAPLVVDYSANHSIVLGNFPHSGPATFPNNLKLIRDFGNGVLLLANKDAN
jgi:hypothetical protein